MTHEFLEVATPDGRHLNVRLGPESLRIGRDPGCDLVLADPRISRQHAVMRQIEGGWMIEASGRNGTRVNGRHARLRAVRAGDVIELAGFQLALRRSGRGDRAEVTQALATDEADPVRARFGRLATRNPGMAAACERLRRVADSDAPLLITGESGTGKELAARALHEAGLRRAETFLPLNCGSLPAGLVESELFGHERGAFTGAAERRAGAFELADRGTLFLDEVGELPLELQPRLLRVLESGEVRRIGAPAPFHVEVRVVAATHRDLAAEVAAGRFRADLLYRLQVLEVQLPPLRERLEDLPLLVTTLLGGPTLPPRRLSPAALETLRRHPWPGNVRELKNVLTRAALYSDHEELGPADLEFSGGRAAGGPALADQERAHILQMLATCGGNRAETARRLGIGRSALFARLRRYRDEGVSVQPGRQARRAT